MAGGLDQRFGFDLSYGRLRVCKLVDLWIDEAKVFDRPQEASESNPPERDARCGQCLTIQAFTCGAPPRQVQVLRPRQSVVSRTSESDAA